MSELIVREHIMQLFKISLDETDQNSALSKLHHTLKQACAGLAEPMRVAIVGLIKAGKSTAMNALLGETLVATGTLEATFNVNWLHYAPEPGLLVHFKDGRPPHPERLDNLERLTRRSEEFRQELLDIEYIQVGYPSELLKQMHLIDTPGLASSYEDDSENTRRFLQLYGDRLNEVTEREAMKADAVLYLFSHSLAAEDAHVLELFQGPSMGHISPINSLGVLTRVDALWSRKMEDTLATGQEIITVLQADHPQIQRQFYTITPICGLLAWGAQTITEEELATLRALTTLPEARLRTVLRDADRFSHKEYEDIPIPPHQRERLLDRLGQYGIWRACQLLRSGQFSRQQITEHLLEISGLPALKKLILSHFGNRAYLIKLESALRQIEAACFWERQNQFLQGPARVILQRVAGRFEQLRADAEDLRILQVLRDYYQGKLPFTEKEIQQLLQITGEFGLEAAQRLGLEHSVNRQALLSAASACASSWRTRAIDPGATREVVGAAEIIADAYEQLFYQITTQAK